MQTIQNIDYSNYIKIPFSIINNDNSLNSYIVVKTPHKGIVKINLNGISLGNFEIPKKQSSIIGELQKIEKEAKDFLLQKRIKNEII